jgi:tRNA nucleotidyltransferase (CCA-adding enzyme)
LKYIDRLGLYSTIFTNPLKETPTPSTTEWHVAYECLSELKSGGATPGSIYKMLIRDDTDKFMSWILAAIVPFAPLINPPRKADEKKIDEMGVQVAREGIKLESKQCAIVSLALRNRLDIIATKEAVLGKKTWIHERDTLGMKIRGWGTNWRLHTMFALLVEAMEGRFQASAWQTLIDHLEEMNLMNVDSAARPLDGKVLSKALGVKPGIWMAPALDVCMAWRLRNPTSENIDEAIEEVRKRKDELKIPEK